MMNMNNNIINMNNNIINMKNNNIMNMNNNMMNSNIMNKTYITLQKEFEFCSKDEILKQIVFNFPLDGYNLFKWKVSMYGAKDTPYEGGIFTFLILFPKNYPNQGPEFKFVNKILHLNVDFKRDDGKCGDGHNSLSSLNEWGSIGKVKDKKGYGVKQALFDIFWLFFNQGTESPYDNELVNLYKNNRTLFNEKAKNWTQLYAKN